MSQRSAFQVQILEKLGAPLMAAVGEIAARQRRDGEDTLKQEAERLAELLGRAVQVSVSLAGVMDLREADGQSDSIRLALAALAGPLIAGHYRLTGKVPGDNDLKRMVKALEAVLTFSDNFAPAAENTARLANIAPGTALADENQIYIQYVNALVPVVNVVAAFPFGRPETKLLQEVADRLVRRAQDICKGVMNGAAEQQVKRAELGILSALATLYVECHEAEMNRLMALDEQARAKAAEAAGGALPTDPVWAAFEIRAAMVDLIGKSAISAAKTAGTVAPKPAPPKIMPAAAPPAEIPAPPADAVPMSPPALGPSSEGAANEGGAPYNPMGFFSPVKKAAGDEGGGGNG